MNSIDNLRDYVLTAPSICSTTRAILVGYIDEIEREVEELRDRDYRNGMEDAKGAVEFADRLKACADNREDVTLFGVDYTPLPVDADGMPIHVGDVMEWVDEPGITRTVTSIQLANDGWWVYISGTGRRPDKYRHHHAPTVEDVLREFGKRWDDPAHYAKGELVDTFAEKLRLGGDGE